MTRGAFRRFGRGSVVGDSTGVGVRGLAVVLGLLPPDLRFGSERASSSGSPKLFEQGDPETGWDALKPPGQVVEVTGLIM